jgi:hypothetical protein
MAIYADSFTYSKVFPFPNLEPPFRFLRGGSFCCDSKNRSAKSLRWLHFHALIPKAPAPLSAG